MHIGTVLQDSSFGRGAHFYVSHISSLQLFMYLVLLCSNKLVHYGRIIESTKDICTLAEQCACTKSGTVCRYIEGCIQRMDAREDLKKKSKKINPEGCMLSLRGGGPWV